MRYRFIDEHRGCWPIEIQCRVLVVSRSGYYAWRRRSPSATAKRQDELTEHIRAAHRQSREIYGSPRVHRELLAAAIRCSKNTVAKLMRKAGLRSKMRRRFVVRTTDSRHAHPVAANRLNREFQRQQPNQAWVADITYIATGEGWLYLAAMLDLCSRKVVGWATSDSLAAELSCQALRSALLERRPGDAVLHHSDRGVQYACDDYQGLLAQHGLEVSMSRPGNCYDNAVMESFFGTLKTELVYHENYPTRDAARQSLFEYIEVFYNRQRRHSSLGYVSPVDHEELVARNKNNPKKPNNHTQRQRPRETREGSHGSPAQASNP